MLLPGVLVLHALLIRWRRWPALHPLGLFPLAYLAWFAIGSFTFVEISESSFFGIFGPLAVDVRPAVLLGYFAYVAGVGLAYAARRAGAARVAAPPVPAWDWQPERLRMVVWGLAAAFAACFLALVAQIGVPVLAADVQSARLAVDEHHALVVLLLCTSWTLFPLAVLLLARGDHREPTLRLPGSALVALVGVTALCLASLGSRGFIVEPALVAVGVWGATRKRISWRRLFVAGGLAFVAISAYGFLRDKPSETALGVLTDAGIPAASLPLIYAYLYVRSTVATAANIMAMTALQGQYQFGALSLGPIATLLPGTQQSADMYFRQLLGYEYEGGGLPATLLGPLFADGGYAAVALGLALFGALSGAVYLAVQRQPGRPASTLLYAWIWHTALFAMYANLMPYLTTPLIALVYLLVARYAGRWRAEARPAVVHSVAR